MERVHALPLRAQSTTIWGVYIHGFYTRNCIIRFGNILCIWVLGPLGQAFECRKAMDASQLISGHFGIQVDLATVIALAFKPRVLNLCRLSWFLMPRDTPVLGGGLVVECPTGAFY